MTDERGRRRGAGGRAFSLNVPELFIGLVSQTVFLLVWLSPLASQGKNFEVSTKYYTTSECFVVLCIVNCACTSHNMT